MDTDFSKKHQASKHSGFGATASKRSEDGQAPEKLQISNFKDVVITITIKNGNRMRMGH
jgi:hypothetical protein